MRVFIPSLLSYDNPLFGHDGRYSVRPVAHVNCFPSLRQILAETSSLSNVHNHLVDYQPTYYLEAHFDEQAEAR